ncbi:MAG TPA: serine hydrolase, partial [Desulfosarcina sp.]|nr:serine hydrolase [Desulfosarcina sp.]
DNFRRITDALDYRTIRPGGPTYRIPYDTRPLPESFAFRGSRRLVTQWTAETATSGLIVVHDGKIAFERYFLGNTPATRWIAWSASDPVVAALVGIAWQEGLIRSVTDLVTDYVPRLTISGYAGVTLKDVLQMSSGIAFDGNDAHFMSDIGRMRRSLALSAAMDDLMVALRRHRRPGTVLHPVCVDTQVLAMVVEEATGRSLSAYLEDKLWSRLGAEAEAFWVIDDHGRELACYGLQAVLRDYARFGLLFLNEGRNFRDQQILPAEWVRASVAADRAHLIPGDGRGPLPRHGYGYQWWLPAPPEGDYCAVGNYGQFIYVHPRHRVVIVKTSADAGASRIGSEMESASLAAFRAIAAHMGRTP